MNLVKGFDFASFSTKGEEEIENQYEDHSPICTWGRRRTKEEKKKRRRKNKRKKRRRVDFHHSFDKKDERKNVRQEIEIEIDIDIEIEEL